MRTYCTHVFVPVAVESSGVFGPKSLSFVRELGRRLRDQSGEEKSSTYLIQRLSMAVQRGNALAILGGIGCQDKPDF